MSEEEQMFLVDEEQADEDGETSVPWKKNHRRQAIDPYKSLPVYNTIHRIRRAILDAIDTPHTIEQLRALDKTTSLVQPLANSFYTSEDVSIVYCLLVNRVEFLHERSNHAEGQSVNYTRALLCELVATIVLRRYDIETSGSEALLLLSKALVTGFDPFQNSPDTTAMENELLDGAEGSEMKSNALELAIISESKSFLSSSPCQKVIDAIHKGRVIYTPFSPIDILPDHYKHTPVSLYDPRRAPVLNQYRLIVPRTRYILEVCQFCLLLLLYFLVMVHREAEKFTGYELAFCIYAFGWVLDQVASMLEHGWRVYTQNLWSFLDVIFAFTYGIYLILRIVGITSNKINLSRLALNILTTGAPVLVPRLAFNVMSNNMLIVALREMMADFAILSLLAVWCSAGFLLSMTWLSNGLHNPVTISKWMLWVWFGLDGTGIEKSVDFHKVLGPLLMIAFAFLGNTLFLTLLVAMLSSDFSSIVANAATENQYRRAVATFGGVKSDSIFAYQPPFNIVAVCLLLPVKFMVSPRWFHKINVAAIKVLNAPLLLIICFYERKYLWRDGKRRLSSRSERRRLGYWGLSRFSVYSRVRAVFNVESYNAAPDKTSTKIEGPWLPVVPKSSRNSSSMARRRKRGKRVAFTDRTTFEMGGNIRQRLETSEISSKRIENSLSKLCGLMEESSGRLQNSRE